MAIARALIKNSPIILFDEPTSALDIKTEEIIKNTINKLVSEKNKTVITITHRLSTICNSDQIIVLNSGSIVEKGTHNELIKNNSFYANLYEMEINTKKGLIYEE